jgi:hypothetical protein
MYQHQLDSYERAVRAQNCGQNVDIIDCYVNLGLQRAQQCQTGADTKRVYFRVISTLEEAMCDHLLSAHWRQHCFRLIKRLTPLIFEILNENEYRKLITKISSLAEYFLLTKRSQQSR